MGDEFTRMTVDQRIAMCRSLITFHSAVAAKYPNNHQAKSQLARYTIRLEKELKSKT